jgi:hypothetical protein
VVLERDMEALTNLYKYIEGLDLEKKTRILGDKNFLHNKLFK